MRSYILIPSMVFIFAMCTNPEPDNKLPAPSGACYAGLEYIHLVDSSRKELFDNRGNSYREITIKVWYPAQEKGDFTGYFEDPDFAVDNF